MEKFQDDDRIITAGFAIKVSQYKRLKTIAVTQRKTVKALLNELVVKHIATYEEEYLVDRFMAIPAIDRMKIIHRINQDEVDDELILKRKSPEKAGEPEE